MIYYSKLFRGCSIAVASEGGLDDLNQNIFNDTCSTVSEVTIQSVTVMTLALHLHCFLASLSFIHFGVILAWPATGIPAIR